MKKCLSFVLVMLLLLNTVPLSTIAATKEYTSGYFTYTVSNTEATIIGHDPALSGDIVIPSELDGYPVVCIGDSAFSIEYDITSIKIEKGIKKIGEKAFYHCKNIVNIEIPNSVEKIGCGAFWHCDNLTKITIPESVVSIGELAFSYCINLVDLTIKNGVKTIDNNAFHHCERLKSLTIPDSVTYMGYPLMRGCNSLETLTLPSLHTSNGMSYDSNKYETHDTLEGLFGYDKAEYFVPSSLKTVILTAKFTTIPDYAFQGCDYIEKIIIPDTVVSIGQAAFGGCSSLTQITIPENVTGIGSSAFSNSGITNIVIPDGVSSLESTFVGCTNLTTVEIPDSVTSMGYRTFANCSNLVEIKLPPNITYLSGTFDGCINLKRVVIPNRVKQIASNTFRNCSSLKSITIPDKVTSIGENSFYGCTKLEEIYYDGLKKDWEKIDISTTGNDSLTIAELIYFNTMGNFNNGTEWKLRSDGLLIISGNDETDDYTSYSQVPWYEYSETITKIEIADTVTHIGNFSFYSLDNLLEVIIYNHNLTFGKRVFKTGTNAVIYSGTGSNVESGAQSYGIPIVKLENQEIPSDPILEEKSQNYIILKKFDGYEYSIDGILWQESNAFENLNSDTEYTFYQRIAEDTYAPSVISNKVTVKTLAPLAPVLEYRTENSVTLRFVAGYKYSIDGTNFQTSPIFNHLIGGMEYNFYQRIVGETNISTPLSITTLCAPKTPTISSVDEPIVKLNAISGYEYSMDGIYWQSSNIFKNVPLDVVNCFYQRIAKTSYQSASPASAPIKVLIVSAPTVLVGFDTLRVKPTENYEYSLDGVYWQDSNFFEVLDGEYYTVYHRYKGNDEIKAYLSGGTTIYTNGKNAILNPTAEDLTWLKKRLLLKDGETLLAADFNADGEVNIIDLVSMKKQLLFISF